MANTEELKQLVFLLPKRLHAELKVRCVEEGVTIKSVLTDLIEKYVEEKNAAVNHDEIQSCSRK